MKSSTSQKLKNITRYTYEYTSFLGWRVTLCRQHQHFVRYFADSDYGGKKQSLAAALSVRDMLYELLAVHPENPQYAYEKCKEAVPAKPYPHDMHQSPS